MKLRALTLVLGAVVAGGCATEPNGVMDTKTPVSELVPEDWALSSGLTGGVEGTWVATFNSSQLSALVAEALNNNPNLEALAANVEQAQALARQAGASLLPSATVSGGADSNGLSSAGGSTSSLTTGVAISWELDLWGRVSSAVAQSQASAQSVQADYLFAQYSVAANAAIAYFAAIEAATKLDVGEENLVLLERILEITKIRYEEGMASAQELALARSDIAATRAQQLVQEGAMRDALRALELLLGRYPSADVDVSDGLPILPSPPPVGLPSELLERRPDLISAERQVAAAFSAKEQARVARLPSVSLNGTLGGSSSELTSLLRPDNIAWSLGASLLAPLYDGGRLRENVNIANAQQHAALARYGEAALRAFSEVEGALDQQSLLSARRSEQETALMESERAFALAQAQYEEGEISLVDLLSFQQRVVNNRSAMQSLQRLSLDNRVQLYLALGGAWN